MKEFKGTPGPWEVHMPGGTCVIDKNEKVVTCLVSNCETDPEADVADALLVAAAHDLLEALQIARDYVAADIENRKQAFAGYPQKWTTEEQDLAAIDAAIAKALGEDHE